MVGRADIGGLLFFAADAAVADGVFVGEVGGEAEFERIVAVGAGGVFAVGAGVGGAAFGVAEMVRQVEAVGIQIGKTALHVEAAGVGAEVGGQVVADGVVEADIDIAFERFARFARNQVDGAAQSIGAVHQRSAALGHAD